MNKLFIIGNGFDLAHGLPTSYGHFISYYWRSNDVRKKNDGLVFLDIDETINVDKVSSFKDIESIFNNRKYYPSIGIGEKGLRYYVMVHGTTSYSKDVLRFENEFFGIINKKQSIQNWVDIEDEYYQKLKSISSDYPNLSEARKEVKKLNEEFEQVKGLLEEYLIEKVQNQFDFNTPPNNREWIKIYDIFRPFSLDSDTSRKQLEDLTFQEDKEDLLEFFKNRKLKEDVKSTSLFLNFNYTNSIGLYLNFLKDESDIYLSNYIHGRLNDRENLINFGFGDEMDEKYKSIENLNENEYLRFFKSFQYFQNTNYKNLLSFVNGQKFQVCVLGHSCGLSDRTLLNTIFEHENCRSIKVYYYEKNDWDNYTETVQNISRHFNNKKVMRDKIVPKSLCDPLPQTVRFNEK